MTNTLGVKSSNKEFMALEVGVDTVYERTGEKKYFLKDEETDEEIWVGWEYDEAQYDKDEYIAEIQMRGAENADISMNALSEIYENQLMDKSANEESFAVVFEAITEVYEKLIEKGE